MQPPALTKSYAKPEVLWAHFTVSSVINWGCLKQFSKRNRRKFSPLSTTMPCGATIWLKASIRLQHIALSADGVAIYRLVVSENNLDQGEIQKIFYKHGPQTAIRVLARYLEKQMKAQRIQLLNAELAAQQFLEMIKGPFVLRALFGESLAEQELEAALNQAIMLFLKGCEKAG